MTASTRPHLEARYAAAVEAERAALAAAQAAARVSPPDTTDVLVKLASWRKAQRETTTIQKQLDGRTKTNWGCTT